MNALKHINSCIELTKTVLGDTNNELTSKQRNQLKKGIRDLKRLRKATKLTHEEVFSIVGGIAEAVFEVLNTGQGA